MKKIATLLLNSVLFGLLFPFPNSVQAEDIARLDSADGLIEVNRAGESNFKPAAVGTTFNANDVVHTTAGARAGIAFIDGTLVRLAENSSLEFKPRDGASATRPLAMEEGRAYFFNREPKLSPLVDTPSATTAVRGTEFEIEVTKDETHVSVLDGAVDVSNPLGSVSILSGEKAYAKKGHAPVKSILIRPLDAVQWSLHYPVVFSDEDLKALSPKFPSHIQEALRLYGEKKSAKARELLSANRAKSSTGIQVYEASLALSDGDVSGAEAILNSPALAQNSDPKVRAAFLSQKAIIALTLNENAQALEFAEEAHRIAPDFAASSLALSYVLQGSLRFEPAKELLANYLARDGSNAFALAHLAELELGSGDYERARELSDEALKLDPDNWYALSVLGFSELIAGDSASAKTRFQQAIEADTSAALPRLGAGLTLIRQGELERGREAIAQAVYLAPNVSIYRSYLGKAFFEEEREGLAGHEYERAIDLDKNDPTPYLYRAFNHLSANQPVLALDDVEESIRLNDNRAVYRSSLLLDQDLGVRSAGLAEAFNALGFFELARTEAIKSLSRDYSNYSAHLLLSESYDSILLNDASLSERKVADLLAPLSFNLFQRQAGEASLNEYSALFDRPESRTEMGMDGSSYKDRISPSARFASKGENFGFGLGFEPVLTGGTKAGDYSRLERAYGAAEYQFGPADRLSFDAKSTYQRFRVESGSPDEFRAESYSGSIGYFHRFSARSKLIADIAGSNDINRFGYNNQQRDLQLDAIFEGEPFIDQTVAIINELDREHVQAGRGSVQHIFDSETAALVTGVQAYSGDAERKEESLVLSDEQEIFDGLDYSLRSRQANILNAEDLYHYATLHLSRSVHLTAGGTWTHVRLDDREISPFIDHDHSYARFNPKVGLVAMPWSSTTLRAAYFESLRKSSLEDNLSIEPTLIGGINQRFTDFSGTRSRNFGGGIDQKLMRGTYIGAELLQRHLVETFRGATSVAPVDFDEATIGESSVEAGDYFDNYRTQDVYRGYWYQVLSKKFVSSVEYESNELRRTDPEIYQDITNQKLRTSLRYFDRSGLFPFVTATWRQQERDGGDFLEDGTDDFWLVDAGIGYRFPNRHGAIAFQILNIFDEEFTYDQSVGTEPFIHSGRGGSLVFVFNF